MPRDWCFFQWQLKAFSNCIFLYKLLCSIVHFISTHDAFKVVDPSSAWKVCRVSDMNLVNMTYNNSAAHEPCCDLGADYMANFSPVSRAEISALKKTFAIT